MTSLALIQCAAGDDPQTNLKQGLDRARKAADEGAQIIAFPELAFSRFFPQHRLEGDRFRFAESIPGPTTDPFCELARETGTVMVLNLFERSGGRAFDASPVIDADGSILGVTRMMHITQYDGFHEQDYYDPGDSGAPVYDTAHGKIGVCICYDRHYPEYFRMLAAQGAELVVIPQAGARDEWPEGIFEAEVQAAAFQNGFFVALVNRVGAEDVLEFAGGSFVCDPWGRIIARAPLGTKSVLNVTIPLESAPDSPARRLFFRHRRPDQYGADTGHRPS